jgi:hypothetical protein
MEAISNGLKADCFGVSRHLLNKILGRPDRLFSIEFVVLNFLITHWTVENDKLRRVPILR